MRAPYTQTLAPGGEPAPHRGGFTNAVYRVDGTAGPAGRATRPRVAVAVVCLALFGAARCALAAAPAAVPRVEVIHWWTSGGEAAAVRTLANAYTAAGGIWVDSAIAGSEQARAVAISRIAGNDAPAAV